MNKPKKIITYRTFDMLHIGHINLLSRAKARGDYLIVGVTSDDYDRSRGKMNVVQSQEERMAAVKALDFVDEMILETHKNQKQEDMVRYGIDEFVIGDDWVGKFDYLNEWTKVVYLPRTEGISSTKLRNENITNLKIGIAGANGDGRRFLCEMRHVGFIEATALYDSSAKRVEKFLRKFDVPSTHDNYAAFLAEDTAAVYIATDISDHYDHIKEALLAGKHVLCENPLVLQSRQAKELFALAKAKNLLLLMALKTAFAPAFNKMLEVLHSGEIGKVREVRATFTSLYGERGFPKRYIRNGATNLLMSYPSLIVHKVAGRSKTITFFDQHNGKYDMANRAVTTHKKGVVGIATVGIEMKSDGHAVIAGTKGYIYIPAPWWLTRTFSIHFEDPAKTHSFEYEFEGDGLRYMIAEFTSLIRQGKIESRRLTIDDMMELNRIIALYNKEKK
jgi:glycerol-3-phosphate cytidylyltransferase